MRVTGGKYRGRRIRIEKGSLEIRPAMDSMRESLFAILGDLSGFSFLDLFAGSGIIGLEAASRGANPVACVEKDALKFPLLLENVSLAEERIECHSMPVERFLLRNSFSFDLVFCDPPFPYRFRGELLGRLAAGPSVAPGGRVLIHFPKEDRLADRYASLGLVDERSYGRSLVRFYRKDPNPEPSEEGPAQGSAS